MYTTLANIVLCLTLVVDASFIANEDLLLVLFPDFALGGGESEYGHHQQR